MNLLKHSLTYKHFSYRQFWFFTVPQAFLTMLVSIFAFLGTSDVIPENFKVVLNTIVGSTSGVIIFLQTMSGVCTYGTRAAMHESASRDLRDLRDDLILLKYKLKIIENLEDDLQDQAKVNGEDPKEVYRDEEESFSSYKQRFQQSTQGCKSNLPLELSEAFDGLRSSLLMSRSIENDDYMKEKYGNEIYDDVVHFKAFDILASVIMSTWVFPAFIPESEHMVSITMASLQKKLRKLNKYWDPEADPGCFDCFRSFQQDDSPPSRRRASRKGSYQQV